MKYRYIYHMVEEGRSGGRKYSRESWVEMYTEHDVIKFSPGDIINYCCQAGEMLNTELTVDTCEFELGDRSIHVHFKPVHEKPSQYDEHLKAIKTDQDVANAGWKVDDGWSTQ